MNVQLEERQRVWVVVEIVLDRGGRREKHIPLLMCGEGKGKQQRIRTRQHLPSYSLTREAEQ